MFSNDSIDNYNKYKSTNKIIIILTNADGQMNYTYD